MNTRNPTDPRPEVRRCSDLSALKGRRIGARVTFNVNAEPHGSATERAAVLRLSALKGRRSIARGCAAGAAPGESVSPTTGALKGRRIARGAESASCRP